MYEENRRGFGLKNLILKVMFILVIIILILWLFPSKTYVSNLIDRKLGSSTNQVFNNNIETMRSAALSYFNGERLPEKVGVTKTLTLKEMIDENLLVEFKDENGKVCDMKKSYAQVTKENKDYKLKVNLSCQNNENYIISYINDSGSEVYSKKKIDEQTETKDKEVSIKENSKQKTQCEYVKNTGGYYTNYGSWSNWQTTAVSKSNTRDVEAKKEKTKIGTERVYVGTKKETLNPTKLKTVVNGMIKYVYVCPTGYDNAGSHDKLVLCYKTVKEYKTENLYKDIVYYRFRDRSYISNNKDYKWGTCENNELQASGYTKTGVTR